jgi:hypothetical protein
MNLEVKKEVKTKDFRFYIGKIKPSLAKKIKKALETKQDETIFLPVEDKGDVKVSLNFYKNGEIFIKQNSNNLIFNKSRLAEEDVLYLISVK